MKLFNIFVSGRYVAQIRSRSHATATKKAKQRWRHAVTRVGSISVRLAPTQTTSRNNPNWKVGKWIKASAVRVRRVAGRVVMDVKKAI